MFILILIFFLCLGMNRLKEYFTRNKTCPNLNDLDGMPCSSKFYIGSSNRHLQGWRIHTLPLTTSYFNISSNSFCFVPLPVSCILPSFPCFGVFLYNFRRRGLFDLNRPLVTDGGSPSDPSLPKTASDDNVEDHKVRFYLCQCILWCWTVCSCQLLLI